MVHTSLSNNTEYVLVDPTPEPNVLTHFTLLYLGLCIQIEDLNDGLGSLRGSQCDDILRPVHENTFGFHGFPLEGEVLGSIDDSTVGCIFDTNILLTFKGDGSKLEKIRVKPEVCQLKDLLEIQW